MVGSVALDTTTDGREENLFFGTSSVFEVGFSASSTTSPVHRTGCLAAPYAGQDHKIRVGTTYITTTTLSLSLSIYLSPSLQVRRCMCRSNSLLYSPRWDLVPPNRDSTPTDESSCNTLWVRTAFAANSDLDQGSTFFAHLLTHLLISWVRTASCLSTAILTRVWQDFAHLCIQ